MDDAFDCFYRKHLPLIFAAALAKTADRGHAEDLVQETMLRAWRHFTLLAKRDVNGQRAWLLTALRHRAIEEWRRQETRAVSEGAAGTSEGPTILPIELGLDVAKALSRLPDVERELVVLRYFHQLNSRDIGEVLGMPEGTVRRKLAEIRAALAKQLDEWRDIG